jgi:hypothetical protein
MTGFRDASIQESLKKVGAKLSTSVSKNTFIVLVKDKNDDVATYEETLSYYDKSNNGGNKYRENKNHWNMPSKERMIDIFKSSGFRNQENVDLVRCSKEYQYVCYFTK